MVAGKKVGKWRGWCPRSQTRTQARASHNQSIVGACGPKRWPWEGADGILSTDFHLSTLRESGLRAVRFPAAWCVCVCECVLTPKGTWASVLLPRSCRMQHATVGPRRPSQSQLKQSGTGIKQKSQTKRRRKHSRGPIGGCDRVYGGERMWAQRGRAARQRGRSEGRGRGIGGRIIMGQAGSWSGQDGMGWMGCAGVHYASVHGMHPKRRGVDDLCLHLSVPSFFPDRACPCHAGLLYQLDCLGK